MKIEDRAAKKYPYPAQTTFNKALYDALCEPTRQRRKDFIEGYKEALKEREWVSVEDELPESGQCVLLYSVESGVAEGAWLSVNNHFEQWRWNAIMTNVTHWMPLPTPPKQET